MTSPPRPLRLLTVCGSLQQRSANRAVLDAMPVRTGWTTVDHHRTLDELPAFDPDRTDTAGPAVEDWRRRVGTADAVLISTPEYAGAIPGALKNALDWLVGTGELYGTPVAVVSAASTGGVEARRMTVQTLTWQGACVVAELGIAAPRTKLGDDGRVVDPVTLAALTEVHDTLLALTTATAEVRIDAARRTARALGIDVARFEPPVRTPR